MSEFLAAPAPETLPARVLRVGINSGIYALTTLLTGGLQFLLVPLYTRYLKTADYGILAVAATVQLLIGIVLGLGLTSAVGRFYYDAKTRAELGTLCGTLLFFLLLVPGACVFALDRAGMHGALEIFAEVPFHPYLRLVLWSAYLSLFVTLPIGIYTSAQRPLAVLLVTVASAAATIGFTLYYVVGRGEGAIGNLKGSLIGNGISAVISIALLWQMAPLRFSGGILRGALLYALPFVPHAFANLVISQSDRFVLQRFIPVGVLGLYSLAGQVAFAVAAAVTAVNSASGATLLKLLKAGDHEHIPPLGTYAFLAMAAASLCVSLLGGDAIRAFTPERFHGAASFLPWLALGYGFLGAYFIWSLGTWFSMRTSLVPLLTGLAGALNLGLNLWLVPRYGARAAAVNMAIGYGALALLHGALAHKLHPIPWEYARWARILCAAALCYGAGVVFSPASLLAEAALRCAVVLVLFPLVLVALGFLLPAEKQALIALLRGRRGR